MVVDKDADMVADMMISLLGLICLALDGQEDLTRKLSKNENPEKYRPPCPPPCRPPCRQPCQPPSRP